MDRKYFETLQEPIQDRHRSFQARVEGQYRFLGYDGSGTILNAYKSVTAELQAILGEAVAAEKEVRAFGALWSASRVALPKHRLVSTRMLHSLRFTVPKSYMSRRYANDPARLRFVEGGESINALNWYLYREGLSLKTSGSNSGQSIAGALSTGTHGAAFEFGSIAEFVVGLHIVTGPHTHVYLQRDTQPVVVKRFADQLGADFVQCDDTFNAALVSFGSFGFIQGVMIEARELFTLHATRFRMRYASGPSNPLKRAINNWDFKPIVEHSELPVRFRGKLHHFQMYINPNDSGVNRCTVLMMFEGKWNKQYQRPEYDEDDAGPSPSGIDIVNWLFDQVPPVLTRILIGVMNSGLRNRLKPFKRKTATTRDMYPGDRPEGKLLLSGTAVPADRAVEAIDIAMRVYEEQEALLPVILAIRFVKQSTATLGFTRFERTCVIDVDCIGSEKAHAYLDAFRAELEATELPFAVHWGKDHGTANGVWQLDADRVTRMYGADAVARWKEARASLIDDLGVAKVLENDFLRGVGLR